MFLNFGGVPRTLGGAGRSTLILLPYKHLLTTKSASTAV